MLLRSPLVDDAVLLALMFKKICVMLVSQMLTGVLLAMHYVADVLSVLWASTMTVTPLDFGPILA